MLRSWAVPKGPPTKLRETRLAMHVEDHPLEYGDFEESSRRVTAPARSWFGIQGSRRRRESGGGFSSGKLHLLLRGKN